jgi:hypothetical protein
VREDEYQGRITNKVDMLLPLGGEKKSSGGNTMKKDTPPKARKKIVS